MVTIPKSIALEAEALSLGETVRIQCVRCHSERPTLTITRTEDGGVVWNCYRASCDERGGRRANGVVTRRERPAPAEPRFRPYTDTLRALNDDEREVLRERVGFDEDHVRASGVRYAPEANRFAFPIWGPSLRRRGWVLRSYNNFVRTKALTHMEIDEPHLSWYFGPDYMPNPTLRVMVVEDIPSAVRASRYITTVALCGTTCGLEYATEIAGPADRVIWALDDDALLKSIDFHERYRGMFEQSLVWPLTQDIKNMTEPALAAMMEELI